MQEIRLDASRWTTPDDFYDALLPALGAPDWHGRTLDALEDSIFGRQINRVDPPFRIRIEGLERIPVALRSFLSRFAGMLEEARSDPEWTEEVDLICEPPL